MESEIKDLEIYKKILEEIEGHVYDYQEQDTGAWKCRHESHVGGWPNNCWKATVAEFIDNQSCKHSLRFEEDGLERIVHCSKPLHDDRRLHEGWIYGPPNAEQEVRKRFICWETSPVSVEPGRR